GVMYTDVVPVTGNGTYHSTDAGIMAGSATLPTTGTVTGTYSWTVHYSGDGNNPAADDQGGPTEQVTVTPATPKITTIPSTTTVTLGTSSVTLKDTADLEGGYHPTGTITFTLYQGSTLLDTETVTVTGNGIYTTP